MSVGNLSADSGVCEKQQALIDLSSKYVSLFVVAMSSSLLTFVGFVVFRVGFADPLHVGALWSIDCIVNVICLYLYHSFADPQYKRYCSRLDGCCKGKMSNSVRLENMDSISKRSRSSETPRAESTANTGDLVIVYENEKSISPSPSSQSPSSASGTDIVFKS